MKIAHSLLSRAPKFSSFAKAPVGCRHLQEYSFGVQSHQDMYRRPRGGRGGRSRGRGGTSRGGGRGRRPNTEDTTANQLPQRHESFPSESTPRNAGFGSNSPRNNLFSGEYTIPNVGFSHSPPQQESFPSDPALGYGRDPPQRDIFPSDSNVSFGRNPPQREPFPSDSVPSDAGFGRKLPPHDHFARDSTPPNVGFCQSPPWHSSIPNDPTSGNSPRHDSFIVDTTPLNIDFGAHSSDPSTAYPPAAQFRRERATPKQTTWQDFEKEELSKGVSLGKHKQIPSPGSEKGGPDDKQLRLDAEVHSQEQEGLAGSAGTGTSNQGEDSREKDGDLGVEGSKDGDPGGKKSKVKKVCLVVYRFPTFTQSPSSLLCPVGVTGLLKKQCVRYCVSHLE